MSVKTLMTAEDLWAMPEVPGKRFELVRGELVEVPGAGGVHGMIVGLIYRLLWAVAHERRLGHVAPDGVSYVVSHDPDVVRVPDVSFVRRERIPADGIPVGYWPFAPDLAIEVVSPNDRAETLRIKVREYLDGGARVVWIAWPDTRSVDVHPVDGPVVELGPDDELDGGDVVPGFRVRVGDLFAVEE